MKRTLLLLLGFITAIAVVGCGSDEKMTETPVDEVAVGGFMAGASVHDPSVIVGDDGRY